MPLPGPPLENVHFLRGICHIAAYTTLRIGRSHRQADRAGVVVDVQNLLPGLASSVRLEYPAFRIGPKQMAQCRYVHLIGIVRIDKTPADDMGLAQSENVQVFPPSVDLYILSPVRTVLRGAESPVPT